MKKITLGFTLIELLAVITLLGLVVLITFPSIEKHLTDFRNKSYDTQVNHIILSTKNWATDNKFIMPKIDGEEISVSLEELIDEGYIELKLRNPKTRKLVSVESYVVITKNGKTFDYEFNEVN